MSEDDRMFFIGILLGTFFGMYLLFAGITIWGNPVNLNKETGNDVCFHLTGNKSIASSLNGKLVCETPSYDSTNNIIVRNNAEGGDYD